MAGDPGPGVAFFESRYNRAVKYVAETPPSERNPEVERFVSSVQLIREACALLPLTSGVPQPAALPDTTATRWRLLTAYVKAVRADHITPFTLMTGRDDVFHLKAYSSSLISITSHAAPAAAEASGSGGGSGGPASSRAPPASGTFCELGKVLTSYAVARAVRVQPTAPGQPGALTAFDAARAALACLSDRATRAAISRQLRQLEPSAGPLTVEQLDYCCHWCVAWHAVDLVGPIARQGRSLPAARQAEVRAAAVRSADALMRLWPDNPKSFATASETLACAGQPERVLDILLRVCQLAQRQRSALFLVFAGSSALGNATSGGGYTAGMSVCLRHLEAGLAAYKLSQRELVQLPRTRKLLPEILVTRVEEMAARTAVVADSARHQVAVLKEWLFECHDDRHAERLLNSFMAERQLATEAASGHVMPHKAVCSSCNRYSLGLRRCARCKKAQYCRRGAAAAAGMHARLSGKPAPTANRHACRPAVCFLVQPRVPKVGMSHTQAHLHARLNGPSWQRICCYRGGAYRIKKSELRNGTTCSIGFRCWCGSSLRASQMCKQRKLDLENESVKSEGQERAKPRVSYNLTIAAVRQVMPAQRPQQLCGRASAGPAAPAETAPPAGCRERCHPGCWARRCRHRQLLRPQWRRPQQTQPPAVWEGLCGTGGAARA
jgi:hypothetical protein